MTSERPKVKAVCDVPGTNSANSSSRKAFVGLVVIGSVFLAACNRKSDGLSSGQLGTIQSRVTNCFVHTVLFKPSETETNSTLALRLAPLIIQEVAGTNASALWQDQFASDASGPRLHVVSGTIALNGRPHDQFSYVWTYSATESGHKAQGVRLTLNARGEPVIWEILADSTGANILFVAQSLELAARAEFGSPLPGCKFSIERSLTDAPDTVVANVIDDGPVPMGPVVYLRKERRDVSTLICRCMASQGGTLLGQTNYAIELVVPQNGKSGQFPPAQLEQRLRLPRKF